MKDDFPELDAYTWEGFAARHSIDLKQVVELYREGRGPRVYRVNGLPYISREEAARWRAEQTERTPQGLISLSGRKRRVKALGDEI
jgi:hypothetical protein